MTQKFLRFPGGKKKALTFSYDDGTMEDIRLIEIFRKYGMKGTFNLNYGRMSTASKTLTHLTPEQSLAVYTEDVCEVACHGMNHLFLQLLDPAQVCAEIIDDRRNLEALFGKQVHGMAYPFGTYNDTVVDIVRYAGIYYARTIESTLKFKMPSDWHRMPATCHHDNPALMELADRFLENKPNNDPQLFYVWGHAFEFARKDNWHIIENFCEKMANKDYIWYATNMEIYNAWADYKRLERSIDDKIIYNPNARSVWLGDRTDNIWEIKPGETIQF